MSDNFESVADKKRAANQVVFRSFNEKIKQGLDHLDNLAAKEGKPEMRPDYDTDLYFYCECADENCSERLKLNLQEYIKIHKSRKRFIVAKGHSLKKIEKLVSRGKHYDVVEKIKNPPQDVEILQKTDVDNT